MRNLRVYLISVLVVLLFATQLGAGFAAQKKYNNWAEVSADMAVSLKAAIDEYKPGDAEAAKAATAHINHAYFKFYEKVGFERAVIANISGKRGSSVENQFYQCKKMIKEGKSVEEVKAQLETLMAMLDEDAAKLDEMSGKKSSGSEAAGGETSGGASGSAGSSTGAGLAVEGIGTFLAVFGLTMREGLEAILVIGAIIAYLSKMNLHQYKKTVYFGALLGVVFSIILAFGFNYIAETIGDVESGMSQEIFEGIAMFVAVVVLFYVSNWMLSKSEAEVWQRYIKQQVESSISKGNVYALTFSAFLAVAREGAELIIFFQGMRSNIVNNPSQMWIGLAVSAALLLAIYIAIAKFSVRLPLKPFFIATSVLMFILCISFLGKGVFELQEAGVIGRTFVEGFPSWEFLDWFGIYPRLESLIPQAILLVVTIITFVLHSKKNKKMRAELAVNNK